MRSFPTAYRAASRSRQRAKALPPPNHPPLGLGPLAGIAVAGWAFTDLMQQINWNLPGMGAPGYTRTPASAGWTLDWDCGQPAERIVNAGWVTCGTGKVVSKAAWESALHHIQTGENR